MSFKTIIQYLSPYRLKISIIIIFAILISVISAILPFISQALIDSGLVALNIQF